MNEDDQRIGRNVAAIRGDTTQQSVADEMRSRGYKWSQATVWSVEKGDRPLRLSEANDLAGVLGVPLSHFFYTEASTNKAIEFAQRVDALTSAHGEMTLAVQRCLSARDVVRQVIEMFHDSLDDDTIGRAQKIMAMSDPVVVAKYESANFERLVENNIYDYIEDDDETIYAIRDAGGEIRQTAHVRGSHG